MSRRSVLGPLVVAAVLAAVAGCGIEAQSEPVRLDSDAPPPPVPTVTQRPDERPCLTTPAQAPASTRTPAPASIPTTTSC